MCPELRVGGLVKIVRKFLRIKLIRNNSIAVLLPAWASAKHPTPLDKNISAAKHLECHKNRIKGRANCLERIWC